ncbi:MAG: response regulator transcription factor [Chloroflexi bacterium]|nr:response regulator transcription factor [Chloroflexota bacterium]
MPEIILVVEDEPALQETLAYNLKKEGYTVETAGDGRAALESARKFKPDLLVLDIMLPELDGFEVARILRREMTTPILMLTARDDEIDRVVGLEVGADDYLTKPFSMRELMARVKAQLRRARLLREEFDRESAETQSATREMQHETLVFDNLIVNLTRREVTLDGQPLQLKPQEYELLLFFAEHKGQMLSREFILERVWGWDYIGDSRTVDVHVRWLRQKIEADSAKPERIVTVRGGGYRFEG